jgi:hypothetical protein
MKRTIFFAVCCLVSIVSGCANGHPIEVGAASAVVSPPNGTCLAGYDHNRKSTGVHDDLYAKAVVFDDGKTPLALVVVDSIGLQYPAVNAIRAEASKRVSGLDLPAERIVVQSTHSHMSPDVIGIYGPDEQTTGYDQKYIDLVVSNAADAVAQAAQRRQPATLVYAQTQCVGWAVNDCEPADLDNSVTVLQALDASGKSIATLTNFACHPTVLDGDTSLVSADWVGTFYKVMAAAVPGEHLFLQGAIGGWIQPIAPKRTFEQAEIYGKDLGEKTLAALDKTMPLNATDIRFAHKVFQVPVANEGFKQLAAAKIIPRALGDTAETEVAWFAIGPAQFATEPGETAPLYSREAQALMKTGPKFILGLGLDELGYILKPDYFGGKYPHAEYLTSTSPGPQTGPVMMDALRQIIP